MVKQIANIIPTETNKTNSTQLYGTTTIFCKASSIRIRFIYSCLVVGYFTTVVVKLFLGQNKCAGTDFLKQTTITGKGCNDGGVVCGILLSTAMSSNLSMGWYHVGCTSYDALYCRAGGIFTDSPVVLSYYRHLIVQMQKKVVRDLLLF